ncbi:transmembrane domain-containing protein [Cryptosporidium canis]|uniref:Transmembrane domain-containing protein n=1 Tax=Cryptosporidium canis TaxID=195482 RepID=A0ABQ8P3B4_9CRYT|nr:transmembrane domain-containing protein [Cryptosporidium canis]KAJ1612493.1 transmembrane domain-containing protein [Cryptosporidium canis]
MDDSCKKNNDLVVKKKINCEIFSTRFRAFLSYFLPLVYGVSLFSVAWIKVSSPIFVAVCLAFGSIDVITSIVGMIGILCPSGLAIRSTIPLLAMENLVTFLISIGLLIESIMYKEKTKDFLIFDFSVGLTISFVLMISTALSIICIWKISEYLNEIEATSIFEELSGKKIRSSKYINSINKISSNLDSKPLLLKSNSKDSMEAKETSDNNGKANDNSEINSDKNLTIVIKE